MVGFDPGYFVSGWDGRRRRLAGRPAARRWRNRPAGRASGRAARCAAGACRARRGSRCRAPRHRNLTSDFGARPTSASATAVQAEPARRNRTRRASPAAAGRPAPDAAGSLRALRYAAAGRRRRSRPAGADCAGPATALLAYPARPPWSRGDGALVLDAAGVDAGLASNPSTSPLRARSRTCAEASAQRRDQHARAARHRARRNGWRGEVSTLQLAPVRGAAGGCSRRRYAVAGAAWSLSRSCFVAEGGGSCARAQWPRSWLQSGGAAPLALVEPC